MTDEDVFMRITNKDIYNKVVEVCDHVKELNGNIRRNKGNIGENRKLILWLWGVFGSGFLFVIGILFNLIVGGKIK